MRVKSTRVTAYIVVDAVTCRMDGMARANDEGPYTFSLELSSGFTYADTLRCGKIRLTAE